MSKNVDYKCIIHGLGYRIYTFSSCTYHIYWQTYRFRNHWCFTFLKKMPYGKFELKSQGGLIDWQPSAPIMTVRIPDWQAKASIMTVCSGVVSFANWLDIFLFKPSMQSLKSKSSLMLLFFFWVPSHQTTGSKLTWLTVFWVKHISHVTMKNWPRY